MPRDLVKTELEKADNSIITPLDRIRAALLGAAAAMPVNNDDTTPSPAMARAIKNAETLREMAKDLEQQAEDVLRDAAAWDREQAIKPFQDALYAAETVYKSPGYLDIVTDPLALFFPETDFAREIAALEARLEKLPDSIEKNMLRDYSKSAQIAYYLHRVSFVTKEEQALAFIKKAATLMGLDAQETQNLINAYLVSKLPAEMREDAPSSYYEALSLKAAWKTKDSITAVRQAIAARITETMDSPATPVMDQASEQSADIVSEETETKKTPLALLKKDALQTANDNAQENREILAAANGNNGPSPAMARAISNAATLREMAQKYEQQAEDVLREAEEQKRTNLSTAFNRALKAAAEISEPWSYKKDNGFFVTFEIITLGSLFVMGGGAIAAGVSSSVLLSTLIYTFLGASTLSSVIAFTQNIKPKELAPHGVFARNVRKLEEQTNTLPNGPEKNMFRDFKRTAQLSFAIENAVHVKKPEQGIKYVEQAALFAGMDGAETQELVDSYLAGGFTAGSFNTLLHQAARATTDSFKSLQHAMTIKTIQLEKPAPSPSPAG